MKPIVPIFAATVILVMVTLFWEPIIDFLPIDQSRWSSTEYGPCYLDPDGDPVSGWYEIDGETYYFTPQDYTPYTGWTDRNGSRCYIVEGRPYSGWADLEEGRYYFREDGTIHTGWLEEDGKRWYLLSDGTPTSGWTTTETGTCYFDDSGMLCTGIVRTDRGIYCFREDGSLYSGWFEQDGKRYFFKPDGTFHTGWLKDDGNLYYLKEDGTAAVGKLVIEEQTHFFSSTGVHFILVNPWNSLPEDFSVELTEIETHAVAPECLEDLQQMLADCREAGYDPQILSAYRSIKDQTYNLNNAVRVRMAAGLSYTEAYRQATMAVAVPGTSEHHLGLAIDIVDSYYPYLDEFQENLPAQKWLMKNSWKYGFIMRYPNGSTDITGIIYEPWHYRYVGREMAKEIYEMGVCLEEYIDMLTNDGTTCGGQPATE